MRACMHVCKYSVCMHVCLYVPMYVCLYVCMCHNHANKTHDLWMYSKANTVEHWQGRRAESLRAPEARSRGMCTSRHLSCQYVRASVLQHVITCECVHVYVSLSQTLCRYVAPELCISCVSVRVTFRGSKRSTIRRLKRSACRRSKRTPDPHIFVFTYLHSFAHFSIYIYPYTHTLPFFNMDHTGIHNSKVHQHSQRGNPSTIPARKDVRVAAYVFECNLRPPSRNSEI